MIYLAQKASAAQWALHHQQTACQNRCSPYNSSHLSHLGTASMRILIRAATVVPSVRAHHQQQRMRSQEHQCSWTSCWMQVTTCSTCWQLHAPDHTRHPCETGPSTQECHSSKAAPVCCCSHSDCKPCPVDCRSRLQRQLLLNCGRLALHSQDLTTQLLLLTGRTTVAAALAEAA